jgi:hypothetical protein
MNWFSSNWFSSNWFSSNWFASGSGLGEESDVGWDLRRVIVQVNQDRHVTIQADYGRRIKDY